MTLPLLLAVACAKIVGDRIEEGCYEVTIHLKHIPYLEPEPEDKAELVEVADVMTTGLIVLPKIVTLEELLHILRFTDHSSFPVVKAKDNRVYLGLLHRDYIICLLSVGSRILHHPGQEPPVPEPLHLIANDLFPSYPSLRRALEWLCQPHLKLMLDLEPYMSRVAHTLNADASLARAHHLFVSVGLRSMPILSRDREHNEVVGILTRSNLLHTSYEQGLDRATERETETGVSRLLSTPAVLPGQSTPSWGGRSCDESPERIFSRSFTGADENKKRKKLRRKGSTQSMKSLISNSTAGESEVDEPTNPAQTSDGLLAQLGGFLTSRQTAT